MANKKEGSMKLVLGLTVLAALVFVWIIFLLGEAFAEDAPPPSGYVSHGDDSDGKGD